MLNHFCNPFLALHVVVEPASSSKVSATILYSDVTCRWTISYNVADGSHKSAWIVTKPLQTLVNHSEKWTAVTYRGLTMASS